MNVSNKLKKKIINGDVLSNDEIELFLKYVINKTKDIIDHAYNGNYYIPMALFVEICYAYNLVSEPYIVNNCYYNIIVIGGEKYLIDLDFNSDKIPKLRNNKYIKYTKDIYDKYLSILKKEK